ncbi:MAG: hypothetical protein HYZ37_01380 [Candidatus Solibacter usitatus]|nr:hypothetical protein [Candidatus Solibacter usitatus]
MAWSTPERSSYEFELLGVLALLQLAEPRVPFFSTNAGTMCAIATKLIIGFLLMGFTGGVISSYHLILLLPVVSAATAYGWMGTLIVTTLASASTLVFLHPMFLDPDRYELTVEGIRALSFRVIFLPVVGFLVNQLAEAKRAEATRYHATAQQLTEANINLQQAEDAMRRSERLVALGQMSAGLAHELRNPLGTVKASAEMLGKSVSAENAVARELAGFISSETDRVNSLITRFLDFAKPLKIRAERNNLLEVLDKAAAELERHTPPFPVTVYKNYSPDVRPFPFDGELMERVVYNLLLNAAQASPPDSAITLKTRLGEEHVEFSVIDRGAGIEPAGLGLAICAKIVDEHHGKITVESEPGSGSVFRVLLPLVAPEASA